MEIEKTEFGFKATVPLITEDEMKIINNDFDNIINKFLKMIIKDKDLATAQYIIKKQQEQINKLKTNSISKKKIEDKIKTYERINKERGYLLVRESFVKKELQELLEEKNGYI